jgi:predicted phosphoribosyltransferase
VRERTIILVDDGLATGATMHAAVQALREQVPAKIVVAIPVCAPETCREMQKIVDEVVWIYAPEWFHGVGQFYEDFSQTSDEEVRRLLGDAGRT